MLSREQILQASVTIQPQPLKLPLHVLLDEALELAKNFEYFWDAQTAADGTKIPGLASLGASLPAELDKEILLTRQLVQEAQTRYLLLRNTARDALVDSTVDSTANENQSPDSTDSNADESQSPDSTDSIADSNEDSVGASTEEARLDSTGPAKADSPSPHSIARGRFVLSELQASLRWLLQNHENHGQDQSEASGPDAQVKEAEQRQKIESAAASLNVLARKHRSTIQRSSALAQALHDYAALARPLRQKLDGLGGFDARLIDEAEYLSAHLPLRRRGRPSPSPQAVQAKHQRDQLASLLQSKMQQVRAAAHFVFRGHKDILQNFASAHQRRLRERRAVELLRVNLKPRSPQDERQAPRRHD